MSRDGRGPQAGPRAGTRARPGSTLPQVLPLVGREPALAVLQEELDQVRRGSFRVMLVTGGAGLGKTRLATEVLREHGDGMTCSSARSYRWGAATSFGVWAEALDRELRSHPEAEVAELCGTSVGSLGHLLTAVGSPPDPAGPPPSRDRLLAGLAELLDNLAGQRPVVLHIDDVHLADTSSWEALRFLARRLSDAPIGIMATARPTELERQPITREILLGLEEEGQLRRIGLDPLTRLEVTELAHAVLRQAGASSTLVPEPLVTWLIDRSLGHPLFAIGLLQALVDDDADLTAPRLDRLPSGLRDRVLLDLQALDPQARRLLEILAVVDRRIDLEDLCRIAEMPVDKVGDTLEGLAWGRLVDEQQHATGVVYEVSHPIVQDTIYDDISGARRRRIHRAVARTMLASGHLGQAAVHFAQASSPGDREAVDALCQAMARAEESGLHQEALAILRALVELLPAGDPRWVQVLDVMDPQSEWVLSHLAENDAATAVEAMHRIEQELADSDDLVARATVQSHLAAFLSFGAGRLAEAEVAARTAIDLFEAADQHEAALLARNELAWIRGAGGDLEGQATLARQVLAGARPDDGRAAIQASGAGAYALGMLGRFDEADELYRRSEELAEAAGNSYRIAWVQAQRGCMLSLCGELADATESVESSLRTDPAAPDAVALEDLAHCHWLAGRLEQALDCLARSAVRRPVRGSRRRAWGAALAARLHAETGQLDRARRALDKAADTYGGQPFLAWGFWEPWSGALLALHDTDKAEAIESLQRIADELRSTGLVAYEALVLADLAEAAGETRDAEIAGAAAGRLSEIAATGELSRHLATLAAAWHRLAAGDDSEAAAAAGEAAGGLGQRGYRIHHGCALQVLGHARVEADRPAAVEALQQAATIFDECGAVRRRDVVLDALGRLGSRGRRAVAAVQGPAALTSREREVAVLAAQGYTAAEIGKQLFIGRRTVESHLASCYAKLGIESRGQLIRRAAELRLVEADGGRSVAAPVTTTDGGPSPGP